MTFGRLAPFPLVFGSDPTPAELWLEEIKAALGDAFSKENISVVGAENIATALMLHDLTNTAQRLEDNAIPASSYDLLLAWCDRLGITVSPDDSETSIRAACVAKYRAGDGNSELDVRESLEALLGDALLTIFYPRGIDGYESNQLCHVLVCVDQPADMSFDQFLFLINVRMFDLLDKLLAAYCSFDFNLGVYSGFELDTSQMDLTAL